MAKIDSDRLKKQAELSFSVDAQLIGELGQKLVASNYIALSELVKNSYDADATEIKISIESAKVFSRGCNSKIIVADNGQGMTFEEIQKYWMRVATAHKVSIDISEGYLRPRTGNKGIGRFSCQKIARKLILESVAELPDGSFEKTKVLFNWSNFKPGSDLELIANCYEVSHSSKPRKTGTTLKLIGLHGKWNETEFNALRRQLLSLYMVSSVERSDESDNIIVDPGVKVNFLAPEFEKGHGNLIEQFMDAGWGRIKGKVNKKGVLSMTLDAHVLGKVKYTYDTTFSKLAGISFDVAFMPLDKEYFRDKSTANQSTIRTMSYDQAGIRVYYENFRVFPYGEPDDDWLRIEHDVARRLAGVGDTYLEEVAKKLLLNPQRANLLHPRNRNLFGKVYTKKSPHFDTKMDREGFLENSALQELRSAMRISLKWMTLQFGAYKENLKKQKYIEAEQLLSKTLSLKKETPEKVTTKALEFLTQSARQGPDTSLKRPVEAIKQAETFLKSQIESSESELSILRMVASSAPMMFVFAHEVRGVVNRLDTHAALIEKHIKLMPESSLTKQLSSLAADFKDTSGRFTSITKMFDIFSGARDSKKSKFYLMKACKQAIDSFGFIADEFHIKPVMIIDPKIKIGPILEAELFSVIVNLYSNAVKASIVSKRREIRIEGAVVEKKVILKVMDKGVGLSKNNWEHVFMPMVRDPEDRIYKTLATKIGDETITTLGQGSGLGLGIVKAILESNSSTIKFVAPPKGWSTCIVVNFNA